MLLNLFLLTFYSLAQDTQKWENCEIYGNIATFKLEGQRYAYKNRTDITRQMRDRCVGNTLAVFNRFCEYSLNKQNEVGKKLSITVAQEDFKCTRTSTSLRRHEYSCGPYTFYDNWRTDKVVIKGREFACLKK